MERQVGLEEAIALEELLLEVAQWFSNDGHTRQHYEGKLYQYEKRRCGKAGCRCVVGNLGEVGHGPCWYAYWKEKGRLRSRYVGNRAPWEKTTPTV